MYVNIFFGFVVFCIGYYIFLDKFYRQYLIDEIRNSFYEDPNSEKKK